MYLIRTPPVVSLDFKELYQRLGIVPHQEDYPHLENTLEKQAAIAR
jgi:hypothetical protein